MPAIVSAASSAIPGPPPAWWRPYLPLFRNGDLQTVAGRYWPAPLDESRWPTEARLFQTEPGVQVLAHLNRQPGGRPRATVLAVHGLTASSNAPYMRTLASAALEAGFDVVRLNVRNCGGTEHLSPTLYHSGLTVDLRRVVEQLAPAPLLLAGFSMGGNMVLKLAGEWAENPPAHLMGVCGISVPIRLGACARRLAERRNRVYETRFLRELRGTLRTKQRLMPEKYPSLDFEGVRTIYDFDDRFTAPAFGYRSADHYYDSCSSAGFLGAIRLPALLIQAADDPFIPSQVFDDKVFTENRHLHLIMTPHGGHVAFLSRGRPRFWAADQALEFFRSLVA